MFQPFFFPLSRVLLILNLSYFSFIFNHFSPYAISIFHFWFFFPFLRFILFSFLFCFLIVPWNKDLLSHFLFFYFVIFVFLYFSILLFFYFSIFLYSFSDLSFWLWIGSLSESLLLFSNFYIKKASACFT